MIGRTTVSRRGMLAATLCSLVMSLFGKKHAAAEPVALKLPEGLPVEHWDFETGGPSAGTSSTVHGLSKR